MTIPYSGPFNRAGDNAQVGFQAQHVTIEGDVKMSAAADESPEAKYEAGVANLNSRNPEKARGLIWNAMMGWEATGNRQVTGEVLFHWLTAMLSERTVRQFTGAEISQLRHFQSRFKATGTDDWAEGVRLIYQLLDSALRSPNDANRPKSSMSRLMSQFDTLGGKQRELLRPLDLFLSGPRKDEMWRDELERARAGQCSVDRLTRAWMFFHPDPAKVVIPEPQPEHRVIAALWWLRASMTVFAVLGGYLALELLWQGAVLALLGYVAGLTGGIAAAAGNLEVRPGPECRPSTQLEVHPDPDARELTRRIGKLFDKYFEKYEPDEVSRRIWADATADARQFYQAEITAICLASDYSADQVAWLIRHEVCQMNRRWRDGSPPFPRQRQTPRSGAVWACRAGPVTLVLGFALAILTLRAHHLLGLTAVLLGAIWAWRCWLRVSLQRADNESRERRQEEVDETYRRWAARLEDRPKDAQMAKWLEGDRTVLLGMALDQFHLSRSSMVAHGFIEKPFPGARRSQVSGGLPRYQKYTIWMYLLAEGGVQQLRASLDFLTGTLEEREHISYGYTSIAAVRMVRRSGGMRAYEVTLTAGEPVKVRVRETDSRPATQDERDEDTDPAAEKDSVTDDAAAPDVASVTNTLRLLQGVVGGGTSWLREHNWANAWVDSQAE